MKEFFQNKSSLMLKFFINQFAMSLFGIMISFTTAANDIALLLGGIFSVLFFYFLIYYFIWEDGAKDALRAKTGTFSPKAYTGLLYCTVAASPSILLAASNTILKIFIPDSGITAVVNMIVRIFFFGSYMGIDSSVKSYSSAFLYFSNQGITFLLYSIPTLAVCFFAYYFGLRGIRFTKPKEEKNGKNPLKK